MLAAERHHVLHGVVKPGRDIDVDVGDDGRQRHGGEVREVVGAEQAQLLAGQHDEENRAARRFRQTGKGARDFQQAGDTGGVVERSMTDVIAIHGRANSQMVKVRGVDDVLIAQRRIGAVQHAEDVRALHRLLVADGVNVRGDRQSERQRLIGIGCREDLRECLRRAGKDFLRSRLAQQRAAVNLGKAVVRHAVLGQPLPISRPRPAEQPSPTPRASDLPATT